MRTLRKIFEAFGLINASPIASIKDAFGRIIDTVAMASQVKALLDGVQEGGTSMEEFHSGVSDAFKRGMANNNDTVLMARIVNAVVAIAEEDAVKASKKGG